MMLAREFRVVESPWPAQPAASRSSALQRAHRTAGSSFGIFTAVRRQPAVTAPATQAAADSNRPRPHLQQPGRSKTQSPPPAPPPPTPAESLPYREHTASTSRTRRAVATSARGDRSCDRHDAAIPERGARKRAVTVAPVEPGQQPRSSHRGQPAEPPAYGSSRHQRTGGVPALSRAAAAVGTAAVASAPPPLADPCSELGCARFGSCSGCSLQDGLAAPPLYGEAKEFFRQLGLTRVPAVMRAAHGWRCRAKLAVRGPVGRPLVGLFREGSHDCVDIVGPPARTTGAPGAPAGGGGGAAAAAVAGGRGGGSGAAAASGIGWPGGAEAQRCRAHHPRINQAAELIKELVTQLRIPPYNEHEPAAASTSARSAAATKVSASERGRRRRITDPWVTAEGAAGLLRYLQLTAVPSILGARAEEDPAAAVQVVLVLNAPPDCDPDDPRVAHVMQLCRLLWRLAGPPGAALAPAPDTSPPPPPPSPTSPSFSIAGERAPAGTSTVRLAYDGTGTAAAATAAPPPLIHSIWLNFQPDARRNTVLGEAWRHVAGPAAAWQDFGGVAACVGPGSFVQANYGAMQMVLEEIAGMVPCGSRVTELHAGIGVIGLSLAARRRLASLRCVEVNPAAAAPFRASLEALRQRRQRQLGPDGGDGGHAAVPVLPPSVEYVTAEAGSDPDRFLSGCDVLVVDPPRKGLGQSLLAALTRPTRGSVASAGGGAPPVHDTTSTATAGSATTTTGMTICNEAELGAVGDSTATEPSGSSPVHEAELARTLPSRLVYLSCGFRALQGDLAALLAGGWRLRSATAHMFFPGTDSLETLVLLTLGNNDGEEGGLLAQADGRT